MGVPYRRYMIGSSEAALELEWSAWTQGMLKKKEIKPDDVDGDSGAGDGDDDGDAARAGGRGGSGEGGGGGAADRGRGDAKTGDSK